MINKYQNNKGVSNLNERPKTASHFDRNSGNGVKLFSNSLLDNFGENMKNKGLNNSDMNFCEKKDFIKKVLITAMKMKIKLNEQLELLTKNETFPEKIILEDLDFLD